MSRKPPAFTVGAIVFALCCAATAGAHHSFSSEFDSNKPMHIEGTVVEFQWVNPHSWLIIDVEQADGSVLQWAIEGSSPSALIRRGWNRDTLPSGTRVIVDGFQAKDGKPRAYARSIEFPDGTSLHFGATGIGAAPE